MIVKNDLFDYPNRYIYQETSGFKFSLDAILLAEFVKISPKNQRILDMCTGNAPIPLILSTKTKCSIVAFEIQPEVYKLAKMSVDENNLTNQIKIINDDVLNIANYENKEKYDIITCNPPFFATSKQGYFNKNDLLTIARHEIKINLEQVFEIVSKYLKDNGTFYMVHRPERLDEIIFLAHKYKINVKELQFIATKEQNIKLVLISCKKNSQWGIKINNTINVNNLKTYQHLFERKI